jgi:hypothetical protein
MFRKSLVLIYSLFTWNAIGQVFEFDLAEYVLPELHYRSSGLTFSASATGADQYFENDFFGENQNLDHRISTSLGWNTYHYHNSPKKQKIRSNALSCFPSFIYDQNKVLNPTLSKTWQVPLFLTSTAIYRHFYRDKRFIQYESKLYTSGRITYDYQETGSEIYKRHSRSFSLEFDPSVLWGFGRVENVIHASHALRILEDFSRFNLLSDEIGKQQIMDLADFLAKRDYTRAFDSRIKYMEDLRMIADMIDSIGLVNETNSTFYASLNDMYQYGAKYGRYAGQSFAWGISGHFNPAVNTQLSLFDIVEYGGGLKAIYQYSKPISQTWQFDVETEIKSLYILWNSLDENLTDMNPYWQLIGNLQFSVGYYPNTRTAFRSVFNADVSNRPSLYKVLPSEVNAEIYYNLSFLNELYYYLSPRAYFSLSLELGYAMNNLYFVGDAIEAFSKSQRMYYNSNIGFGYAIY